MSAAHVVSFLISQVPVVEFLTRSVPHLGAQILREFTNSRLFVQMVTQAFKLFSSKPLGQTPSVHTLLIRTVPDGQRLPSTEASGFRVIGFVVVFVSFFLS